MIISALTEQYPGIENLPGALDKVREHTVDEFNFYVEDGHVWIGFDEYEIADGAARVFDVELPVTPGQAESAEPAEADGTGAAPEAFTVQQPSIQRVDWDQPTNCTEVYFERPVFDSTAQGYGAINTFFEQKQEEFFSTDNQLLMEALRADNYGNPQTSSYSCTCEAAVETCTEVIFSVSMLWNQHDAGSPTSVWYFYTFDPKTGRELELSDLVSESGDELKEKIEAAFPQAYPRITLGPDGLAWDSLEDFGFFVKDNQVVVVLKNNYIDSTSPNPYYNSADVLANCLNCVCAMLKSAFYPQICTPSPMLGDTRERARSIKNKAVIHRQSSRLPRQGSFPAAAQNRGAAK